MDVDSVNPVERIAHTGRVGGTQDREKRRRRGDEFILPHIDEAETLLEDSPQPHIQEPDSVVLRYDEELEQAFRERGDLKLSICGNPQAPADKPLTESAAKPAHPNDSHALPEHLDTEV